jgi:hypothetical protein
LASKIRDDIKNNGEVRKAMQKLVCHCVHGFKYEILGQAETFSKGSVHSFPPMSPGEEEDDDQTDAKQAAACVGVIASNEATMDAEEISDPWQKPENFPKLLKGDQILTKHALQSSEIVHNPTDAVTKNLHIRWFC